MIRLTSALTVLATTALTSFASASQNSVSRFECAGANVSGVIQITHLAKPVSTTFPYYKSVAKLRLNGIGNVTIQRQDQMQYFKKSIFLGRGAWEFDRSRPIFNLGGHELKLNAWPDVFRLEMNRWGQIRGYLGHRDADQNRSSHGDDTRFDFTCRQI